MNPATVQAQLQGLANTLRQELVPQFDLLLNNTNSLIVRRTLARHLLGASTA